MAEKGYEMFYFSPSCLGAYVKPDIMILWQLSKYTLVGTLMTVLLYFLQHHHTVYVVVSPFHLDLIYSDDTNLMQLSWK